MILVTISSAIHHSSTTRLAFPTCSRLCTAPNVSVRDLLSACSSFLEVWETILPAAPGLPKMPTGALTTTDGVFNISTYSRPRRRGHSATSRHKHTRIGGTLRKLLRIVGLFGTLLFKDTNLSFHCGNSVVLSVSIQRLVDS